MVKPLLVGIDRDGTLIKDVGYFGKNPAWKKDILILDKVVDGIKILNRIGAKIVVITNQSGVARGYYDEKRIDEINAEINKRLVKKGALINGWYFTTHVTKEYAIAKGIPLDNPHVKENSENRKPGTGLLKEAATDLGKKLPDFDIWFIGDKEVDVATGLKAGGRGILVLTGESTEYIETVKKLEKENPGRVFIVKTLEDAALLVKKLTLS